MAHFRQSPRDSSIPPQADHSDFPDRLRERATEQAPEDGIDQPGHVMKPRDSFVLLQGMCIFFVYA
jgi:hypothetical protein